MKEGGVYSLTRDKLNHYSRRVVSTFIDASPFAPPLSLASPFRTSSSPSKTCPKAVLSLNYPRTRSPSAPRPAATNPASQKPPCRHSPLRNLPTLSPIFSPIQVPLMDGRRSRSARPDTQTASEPGDVIPSTPFPSKGGPSFSSSIATLAGPPMATAAGAARATLPATDTAATGRTLASTLAASLPQSRFWRST